MTIQEGLQTTSGSMSSSGTHDGLLESNASTYTRELKSPYDANDDNGVNQNSPMINDLPNHGIKKVIFILPSYVKASLEKGDDGYKGTERSAVYTLSELVSRGIEVHLIAPKGSNIPGVILHPSCDTPHWDFSDPENPRTASEETRNKVLRRTIELMKELVAELKPDIVDCHIAHNEEMDQALTRLPVPHMVTFHGPTKDMPALRDAVLKTPQLPVVTVSELQQKFLPEANYVGVVPNGLPRDAIPFRRRTEEEVQNTSKSGHLVMLTRLSPKKDIPRGIEIAKQSGRHLVIGGALLHDQRDRAYFDSVLGPLLAGSGASASVTLRGDVGEANKAAFLAGAAALLALTKRRADDEWGPEYIEADGMHITEALAAGVPVLCDAGVDPAKVPPRAGFRGCDTVAAALDALAILHTVRPEDCRAHFLDNYTVDRTVDKRLRVYAKLVRGFFFSGSLVAGCLVKWGFVLEFRMTGAEPIKDDLGVLLSVILI
ncbi:hypothetical protein F5X96DRAFT_695571 [Biscogniauxia mediterranea]|nr:hypothetical protein F5X96DRAFT_695571 [Biscogniauxia mediterranea]